MHVKPNIQLFPKQLVIQLPQVKTAVTFIFTYLKKLHCQVGNQEVTEVVWYRDIYVNKNILN